jgi:putative colanic acid biosysnthesis UDP-glucose lipid carrier transferase
LLLLILFRLVVNELVSFWKEDPSTGNALLVTIILFWLVLINVFRMNHPDHHKNAGMILSHLMMLYLPFLIISVVYCQVIMDLKDYTMTVFIVITVFILATLLDRILLKKAYDRLHQSTFFRKKAVIVGCTQMGFKLYSYFQEARHLGIDCVGFFDDRTYSHPAFLGKTDEVQNFVMKNNICSIYVTLQRQPDLVKRLSRFAEKQFIRFYLVPELGGMEGRVVDYNVIRDLNLPILSPRREPLRFFFNLLVKRVFDFIVSSIVLIIFFPVLYLIVGTAIRLESRGPILFKQKRIGHKGKLFWCYKFRTMYQNEDADLIQASKHDTRITKIGNFLRRTSLDEFPQFINVFRGEMSVVGPRPHMIKHNEEYSKLINAYLVRHFAPTGITGYAQINGFRGEITKLDDMKKRVEYDQWYLNNWSLRLDIKIMLTTAYRLLAGDPKAY